MPLRPWGQDSAPCLCISESRPSVHLGSPDRPHPQWDWSLPAPLGMAPLQARSVSSPHCASCFSPSCLPSFSAGVALRSHPGLQTIQRQEKSVNGLTLQVVPKRPSAGAPCSRGPRGLPYFSARWLHHFLGFTGSPMRAIVGGGAAGKGLRQSQITLSVGAGPPPSHGGWRGNG